MELVEAREQGRPVLLARLHEHDHLALVRRSRPASGRSSARRAAGCRRRSAAPRRARAHARGVVFARERGEDDEHLGHEAPRSGGVAARAAECSIECVTLALPPFAFSRALGALALLAAAHRGPCPALPPIVFVSRQPRPRSPRAIPGLGPHQRAARDRRATARPRARRRVRAAAARGRAVRRRGSGGVVRRAPHRVRRHRHPDSGWRICVVGIDGTGLRARDRRPARLDGPSRSVRGRSRALRRPRSLLDRSTVLCFASTRYPLARITPTCRSRTSTSCATTGGWRRRRGSRPSGTAPRSLPSTPRAAGSCFARWWFNRWLAARTRGDHRAILASARCRATRSTLAGDRDPRRTRGPARRGRAGSRRGTMAYQPALARDGT